MEYYLFIFPLFSFGLDKVCTIAVRSLGDLLILVPLECFWLGGVFMLQVLI